MKNKSPHMKNKNPQNDIYIASLSMIHSYAFLDGKEDFDVGNCDSIDKLHVRIILFDLKFEGFIYHKKEYIDEYIYGYDAMMPYTFRELVYDNDSLYLVQSY